MNLVILGPQGSGKGAQAKLLVKKLGLAYFEPGKIFRQEAEKKTTLGKRVANYMSRGKLVPDPVIRKVLDSFLTKSDLSKGVVFDGIPRNLSQSEDFEKELGKKKIELDRTVLIDISEKESIRRLTARRICPQCGRVYNLLTLPPKKDEKCDDCQSKLISRKDESVEAIKERLKTYREQTLPVVGYYRKKGILLEIDGERPIEVIHQDIMKRLKREK